MKYHSLHVIMPKNLMMANCLYWPFEGFWYSRSANHTEKIKQYGVREKALTWLQIYFFQRKQYIENNNDIKYLLEIDCGVPQRYILGPLLFLIYVNDFYLASNFKNSIFADDTNLFLSDENIGELSQLMNKELKTKNCLYLV